MKSKNVFFYIVIALSLLILLIYIVWKPDKIYVEAAIVKMGVYESVIKSDGRFRSKNRYILTSHVDGTLQRVELKPGDQIKKGQKLAVIEWDYVIVVKSPIDGVISKVYKESSGPIARGEPIIEIVDPDNLEVVAELLTSDAVQVKKNNLIRIENWGGAAVLEAKVTSISAAGFTKLSALGVEEERTEVVGELLSANKNFIKNIGDNFHIDVLIVTERAENVLKIPVGSLFKSDESWAVYIIKNNKASLSRIKIRDKNYDEAWVTEGLNEGDSVILHPGDLVKNGVVVFISKYIN